MKLGLLADIHEHNEHLAVALKVFHQQGVRQVVVLGDTSRPGNELMQLLASWRNPMPSVCGATTTSLFATPLDNCCGEDTPRGSSTSWEGFSRCWRSPVAYSATWNRGSTQKNSRISGTSTVRLTRRRNSTSTFEAVPHSIVFIGHFHRWLIATPEGILDWHGDSPIQLSPAVRYLIVVGANCDGWYGIFDTLTRMLIPFRQSGLLQDRAAGIA